MIHDEQTNKHKAIKRIVLWVAIAIADVAISVNPFIVDRINRFSIVNIASRVISVAVIISHTSQPKKCP